MSFHHEADKEEEETIMPNLVVTYINSQKTNFQKTCFYFKTL